MYARPAIIRLGQRYCIAMYFVRHTLHCQIGTQVAILLSSGLVRLQISRTKYVDGAADTINRYTCGINRPRVLARRRHDPVRPLLPVDAADDALSERKGPGCGQQLTD